jgi:2-phospho-L-lactate guanylyltransferase
MKAVKAVIPYKPENPKSRLSAVFSERDRKRFLELSLENVLQTLKDAGIKQIEIISKSPLHPDEEKQIKSVFIGSGAEITIFTDRRDLNTAINEYLKKSNGPVLIVMADLALLTKNDVSAMIYDPVFEREFVRIAPGKDGGTNMLYIKNPQFFEVNYYGESCRKHKEEAERRHFNCEIYESFSAASDMDEPEDLESILTHGKGELQTFVRASLNKKSN